jgi:hypothetical protein
LLLRKFFATLTLVLFLLEPESFFLLALQLGLALSMSTIYWPSQTSTYLSSRLPCLLLRKFFATSTLVLFLLEPESFFLLALQLSL